MSKQLKNKRIPKLRFPEFKQSGEWFFANGDQLFDNISNKIHNSDLPILAITQEHGAIPRNEINYSIIVSDKSLESYKVVEIGDFIISLRSFQGGIEYSNYKGICSPAYIILRKKSSSIDTFFRYYFKTNLFIQDLNKNIEGLRDGKMVSYKQFSEIMLPSPHPKEQQKIAECLSSIDELILAQNKKLLALKTYKTSLLHQLFSGAGETLPKFRFSEFHNSPEWTEKNLSDLALNGFSNGVFNDPDKVGSGYKLINVLDMYIDTAIDENNLNLVGISEAEFSKNKVVFGDIFFTRSSIVPAGIAHSNIYLGKANDVTFDGHLIRLRPDKRIVTPIFLHYLLKTNNVRTQLISKGKRATMTTIGQADIASTSISIPLPDEQKKIAECMSTIDELIHSQTSKLNTYKSHKKGLMQQLFPTKKLHE